MITDDLYLGLIKMGDEKTIAAIMDTDVIIISGSLHLYNRCSRLTELSSLFKDSWFNGSAMFCLLPERGQK